MTKPKSTNAGRGGDQITGPPGKPPTTQRLSVEQVKEAFGAIAAAFTIVGGITFAAQRVAYERFYDAFGIAPEDVGIDATRSLSQSAAGIGSWLAVIALPTAVALVVVRATSRWSVREIASAIGWVSVFGALLIFATITSDADDAGACAARPNGQPVRSMRVNMPFFGTSLTVLGVRAERAVIRKVEATQEPPSWDGRRVVYLGTLDGSTLVFDPRAKSLIRVPASAAVVTVDTAVERFQKKRGCKTVQDRPLG